MIKHIEIVDVEKRDEYVKRFTSQVRRFRYMGFMVIIIDAVIIALLIGAFITGATTVKNMSMAMAMVAVFSIPFLMMNFNRSWQLGSDVETDRVQVYTGRISKIKKETKGRKTFLILTVDKVQFKINEEYCSGIEMDAKVSVVAGINSNVPVSIFPAE